jgi:hypothetical protein
MFRHPASFGPWNSDPGTSFCGWVSDRINQQVRGSSNTLLLLNALLRWLNVCEKILETFSRCFNFQQVSADENSENTFSLGEGDGITPDPEHLLYSACNSATQLLPLFGWLIGYLLNILTAFPNACVNFQQGSALGNFGITFCF